MPTLECNDMETKYNNMRWKRKFLNRQGILVDLAEGNYSLRSIILSCSSTIKSSSDHTLVFF